jgi:hypothetical protein
MLTGAADDGVAVTALAQCEDEVVDWRGIGAEKQFLGCVADQAKPIRRTSSDARKLQIGAMVSTFL